MANMPVKWKVKPYLDRYGVSNYRFWQDTGLARQTAYDIANGIHEALDQRATDKIIPYLRRLANDNSVDIGDVVEYKE